MLVFCLGGYSTDTERTSSLEGTIVYPSATTTFAKIDETEDVKCDSYNVPLMVQVNDGDHTVEQIHKYI